MTSVEFDRFKVSCFDKAFGIERAGLDVRALLNLNDEERQRAEEMLLGVLGTTEDSRPIEAVGWLGLHSAVDTLKQRLESNIDDSRPENKVAVALALYRIEGLIEAVEIIIEVLEKTDPSMKRTRWLAVDALQYFQPSRKIVETLLGRLFDEDLTVAIHTRVVLTKLFRPNPEIEEILMQIDSNLINYKNPGHENVEKLTILIKNMQERESK